GPQPVGPYTPAPTRRSNKAPWIVLAAVLVLAGCSSGPAVPAGAASSSAPCPMVGPNGCETASPGSHINAKLDPRTRAACTEITLMMKTNAGLDLVDMPLQVVIDDASASPNIDVRTQAQPLHDAWIAADKAKGTQDETSTKLKLAAEAIKLETA